MSIKCGNHKLGDHRHASVQEVKTCCMGTDDLPIIHKSVAPSQVINKSEQYADIAPAYYATKSITGNNDLDFWKVDKPSEGKWAGYIFVMRVIGGNPHKAVSGREKFRALEEILKAGPRSSATLFGQTIGRCWRCGRHLTDETSRSLGIGPECRSKVA